jgi:hypothetical protein
MKSLYFYGASDDLEEMESDFGLSDEFVGDILINDSLKIVWSYDGDWHLTPYGRVPKGWIAKKISGTSDFIHLQVPESQIDKIKIVDLGLEDE